MTRYFCSTDQYRQNNGSCHLERNWHRKATSWRPQNTFHKATKFFQMICASIRNCLSILCLKTLSIQPPANSLRSAPTSSKNEGSGSVEVKTWFCWLCCRPLAAHSLLVCFSKSPWPRRTACALSLLTSCALCTRWKRKKIYGYPSCCCSKMPVFCPDSF